MRTLVQHEIAGFDRSKQSHISRGTAFDLLQLRPVRGDLLQVDHIGYFVDEFGNPVNQFLYGNAEQSCPEGYDGSSIPAYTVWRGTQAEADAAAMALLVCVPTGEWAEADFPTYGTEETGAWSEEDYPTYGTIETGSWSEEDI